MKKKIQKVLLFIPPVFTAKRRVDVNPLSPLGLAYLGAVMENSGIEVKIFDCMVEGWEERVDAGGGLIRIGTSFEEIERIIASFSPDMVGVNNLFTTQRANAHKIYELAKKTNDSIVTVAGGAHPTVMPELVLEDRNVDFVVLGEGENTLMELIRCIETGRDVSSLDGLGFRESGKVRVNPKTKFIEDLDSLPFPARHLLNMEKYFGMKASHGTRTKKRFSPIVTSRGCPAACTFCSAKKVWGRKFRSRSPENVIAEMKHLKDKYGIEEIMFEDDNVTLDVERAGRIFDLMTKEKLDFVWDTPNGVAAWTLTTDLIDMMKESGCHTLNFAVETGNQHVMDNIVKKPVKLATIPPLIDHARKKGLKVGMFLVMGMPGETEEQMWESFRFARDNGVYFPHVSVATPYPGSELYDICLKKRYLNEDFSLDDLFIKSFPISTGDWNRKKLREIYAKGQRFLLLSHLKDHPARFAAAIFDRLRADPANIFRKLVGFIKTGGDWCALR